MAFQSTTNRVWKKHKYIRKEGNRYIYPEDLKRMQNSRSKDGKLVRTITDANGNKVRVRGAAATNTIASRSNHYDRASGERFSPSEYRTRMQDGSIDRMRGQVTQEAAKKQGQYSVNMMRQQKAAQQRSVPRQTMTSTPANLRINKQVQKQNAVRPVAHKKDPVVPKVQKKDPVIPRANSVTKKDGKLVRTITDVNGNKIRIRGAAATNTIAKRSNYYDKTSGERLSTGVQKRTNVPANLQRNRKDLSTNSQNVSTAASQAMQRAGYNGPVRRPQNQHVVAKTKKEETKTDTKSEERIKSLEKEIAELKKTSSTTAASDEDKKTTTKSSSTRSSGSSRSSSGSSGRSSSGSSSSGSSSNGSGSSNSGSSSSGSSTLSSGSSSGSSTRSSKSSSSSSKKSKSSGGSSGSSSSSSESSDNSDKKEGAVLGAVDKKKDKKKDKKSEEEKIDEEGMLEDLESVLDPNMNLENMSESKINSIADRLGVIFSTGKSEVTSNAQTKVKDSKSLVSMGLNLLKELKAKTQNKEKSK